MALLPFVPAVVAMQFAVTEAAHAEPVPLAERAAGNLTLLQSRHGDPPPRRPADTIRAFFARSLTHRRVSA